MWREGGDGSVGERQVRPWGGGEGHVEGRG